MQLRKQSRFTFADLLPIVLTLVIIVMVVAFTSDIVEDTADDLTENSTAWNATQDGQTALAKVPAKLPTIITVALAIVIITMLTRNLMSAARAR